MASTLFNEIQQLFFFHRKSKIHEYMMMKKVIPWQNHIVLSIWAQDKNILKW